MANQQKIINTARNWLAQRPVYLDTETTGFKGEIIDLAIVDTDGTPLIDTLLRPNCAVEPQATRVHGLTNVDLMSAPTFAEIYADLSPILAGRLIVIYNANFDVARLKHTADVFGVSLPPMKVACAMELYAEYHGDWDSYHGSYRWQKLNVAARQCGLDIPENLHRAAADADLTRRLIDYLGSIGR